MFALLDVIQQKRCCLYRCRVLLQAMESLAIGVRRYLDSAHHYVRQHCHADPNMHLARLRLDQALPKHRCQIRCQRTSNDLRTLRMKVCMFVSSEISSFLKNKVVRHFYIRNSHSSHDTLYFDSVFFLSERSARSKRRTRSPSILIKISFACSRRISMLKRAD